MPYADPEQKREYKRGWRLRRTAEKRKWLNEYKRNKPCSRCGKIYDPLCLDLHHLDPMNKVSTISFMIQGTHSLKVLKEEVAKCEVICANCHRLHHYKN
jgi:hypothetical protein